jgi:type I restriction enzyme S subunit
VLQREKILNSDRAEQTVLSLTLRGVVENDPDNPEGLVPSDYATYQIFEADDLVFKLIDLENVQTSRVGHVHRKGIMSSAYLRLRPIRGVCPRYLYWQFFDLYNRRVFNQLGNGVRSTLGAEDVLSLPLAIPTLPEQQAIADYLDRETARIDTLIAKKQQFIELLGQRFDALIRDSVAGIGDAVRPPWLPAMAADRRLARLGSVLELRREKNNPVTIRQVLSLTADRGVILYEEKGDIGNKASEDISRYSIVRVGDIVMNSMNVIIGSVGLSRHEGVLSPVYYVMHPVDDALTDRRFLAYHFRIREFQRQLVRLGYGILDHRIRIPWVNLKAQEMVLPPRKTQAEIADVLDEAESVFRSTLGKAKTSIALLRERRQVLITAAVTGELEVTA